MIERTLVLVKPDAVRRGLVGEVLDRLERTRLHLVALELRTLDRETAEEHYAEHVGKPFFESLIDFITSGPLVAAAVEGPRAIETWRAMMGPTDPVNALRARSGEISAHRDREPGARLRLAGVGRPRGRPLLPAPVGLAQAIAPR